MHYFETGSMANGEPGWHSLGNVLPKGQFMTPDNVLTLSGIDWKVGLHPLYLADGKEVEQSRALVRESDGSVLNVVGKQYHPEQNENLVVLAQALTQVWGEELKFETAMSLKGGQVVTLLARVGEFELFGDRFYPYLSLCNYHGGGSRKVYATNVREVCWNTHSMSIGSAKHEKRVWSKPHKKRSLQITEATLQEAREILAISTASTAAFQALAETLVSVQFNLSHMEELARHLFPPQGEEESQSQKDTREEKGRLLKVAYQADDLANFRGTAWAALGAVTNYQSHVTHGVPMGKQATKPDVARARQESRFLSSLEAPELESKALEYLLALA